MIQKHLATIFNELRHLPDLIESQNIQELLDEIVQARKIVVLGAGRSALALKMVAMRLRHLGFDSFVAGETISPSIGQQDLLIVGSGSGRTESICTIAKRAKENGATIWAFTGSNDSPLASMAHNITLLPTRDNVPSIQFGGSLFEASILLLGDALVLELLDRTKQQHQDMFLRHTNLE